MDPSRRSSPHTPAGNVMARVMAARRKGFHVVYADDFDVAEAASGISKAAGGFIPVEEDPTAWSSGLTWT